VKTEFWDEYPTIPEMPAVPEYDELSWIMEIRKPRRWFGWSFFFQVQMSGWWRGGGRRARPRLGICRHPALVDDGITRCSVCKEVMPPHLQMTTVVGTLEQRPKEIP
jgi:hypothetical protein